MENVQELLQSIALYPMTRLKEYVPLRPLHRPQTMAEEWFSDVSYRFRMPLEDFNTLVEEAREEAKNPSLKVRQVHVRLHSSTTG